MVDVGLMPLGNGQMFLLGYLFNLMLFKRIIVDYILLVLCHIGESSQFILNLEIILYVYEANQRRQKNRTASLFVNVCLLLTKTPHK